MIFSKKKVLLYAYDGTGLGHLSRLIKIASGFSDKIEVLLVSGHKALPELVRPQMSFIQLPYYYEERKNGKTKATSTAERIISLHNIIQDYKPDAFVTDYLPLGKRMELQFIITKYKCKKYFILRSDIGGLDLTYKEVFSKRNLLYLSNYYDRILIASDTYITPRETYSWLPTDIKKKIQYVGFVTYLVSDEEVLYTRSKFIDPPRYKWIVCSVGGGQKGTSLIKKCIELSKDNRFSDFQIDIILGKYSPLDWQSVATDSHFKENVRISKWIDNLYLLHASADCIVCSGAYNTLLECMQGKNKTVISSSVQIDEDENEQTQNIEAFGKYYNIHKLSHIHDMGSFVLNCINKKNNVNKGLKIDGIYNVCKTIEGDLFVIK